METKIESHYHDFYKVVFFLAGEVTYSIEGTNYTLQADDILLIHRGTIHKPLISQTTAYSRYILWFNPSFLEMHSDQDFPLSSCFDQAQQNHTYLLQPPLRVIDKLKNTLNQIEDTKKQQHFADLLLQKTLALELLIFLNRAFFAAPQPLKNHFVHNDETITKIIQYIHNHLAENLTIETLSAVALLSKYYLMRKFKEHTGYSLHNYILQKRLIRANQLIEQGQPLLTASLNSGFRDYSNFTRTFKKNYGSPPKKYHACLTQARSEN